MANSKDFALIKTSEIIQLCNDLFYVENKELRRTGLDKIQKLAEEIEEHLEYLDIKQEQN